VTVEHSRMESFKRRLLDIACGTRTKDDKDDDDDEDEDHVTRVSRIQEKNLIRRILNVNAIIVMTVTVFLYGFFY